MHLNVSSAKWWPFCSGLNSSSPGATYMRRQCWKFPQVCRSEADNFGEPGPGTFVDFTSILCLWFEIQGMNEDLQLFFTEFQTLCVSELDHHWYKSGFYTKGRPLVKSNLICPSDKLSRRPGCPVLNNNIQGNFFFSQGNGSSDNLPENLV